MQPIILSFLPLLLSPWPTSSSFPACTTLTATRGSHFLQFIPYTARVSFHTSFHQITSLPWLIISSNVFLHLELNPNSSWHCLAESCVISLSTFSHCSLLLFPPPFLSGSQTCQHHSHLCSSALAIPSDWDALTSCLCTDDFFLSVPVSAQISFKETPSLLSQSKIDSPSLPHEFS